MKEQNLRVLPRVLVKSKLFCFISSLEETKSIDKSENLYDNIFTCPKLSVFFGVGIVIVYYIVNCLLLSMGDADCGFTCLSED